METLIMKKQCMAAATVIALTMIVTTSRAKDRERAMAHKLPNCPVMGEEIDFSVSTDTKDGPVYFCCPKCIRKFNENPSKYSEEVGEQRTVLASMPKVQVKCPVSGEPIDPTAFAEVGGKKIYACCNKCAAKIKADPKKYSAALAGSYTYQAVCPVSGEEISATAFSELPTGQTVYFCCNKCKKSFLETPAKYTDALAKQGVHVDAKKLASALSVHHAGTGDDGSKSPDGHDHH